MTENGVATNIKELIRLKEFSKNLTLLQPQQVGTDRTGGFTSRFRGRGVDFEEVRVYQAGDDIRTMDWRVTARTGIAHTKVFREERERPVFLVVDHSTSMFFGTKVAFKSVTAARTAAIIAWAAAAVGDRVGGIVASPMGYFKHRPLSRQQGVLPLLKSMVISSTPSTMPTQKTTLCGALKRLQQVIRPGSLVFILSDFQPLDTDLSQQLSLLTQHNDLMACFIYDKLEQEPPPPNYYAVTDGEKNLTINTYAKNFCDHYRQQFQQRQTELKQLMNKHAIPLVALTATDDIIKTLNKERQRGK